MQYLGQHQCFTYDQHSWGTYAYHHQFNLYTCTSYNVVYLIKCRTSNKVYIGETGRCLGDRFRDHLRSTRQSNTDLPVGRHFASPGHASTDRLSVIHSGFRDTQNRRLIEARMIFKHKTLHPGGLNTDFAFL